MVKIFLKNMYFGYFGVRVLCWCIACVWMCMGVGYILGFMVGVYSDCA